MTAYPPGYYRELRRRRAAGDPATVPAVPVREHVARLHRSGASTRAIASAADVTPDVTRKLLSRRQSRINATTARRLLAVTLDSVLLATPGGADVWVPGAGTVRRIQAALLAGWPHGEQSRLSGVDTSAIMRSGKRRVLLDTHLAVRAMSGRLHGPGPAPHAAAVARGRGYLPLSAWDDVDDPDSPCGASPVLSLLRSRPAAEVIADVLLVADEPLHVAAARIGMSEAALEQALIRHRPDLLARLKAASARWRLAETEVAS